MRTARGTSIVLSAEDRERLRILAEENERGNMSRWVQAAIDRAWAQRMRRQSREAARLRFIDNDKE